MWVIIVAWALVGLALFGGAIGAVVVYILSDPTLRQGFSRVPLGLQQPRPGPHAVQRVGGTAACWHEWVARLPRGQRYTLGKQVPKALAAGQFHLRTVPVDRLGFAHWLVVLDHQRRRLAWPIAVLVSGLRFLSARLMVGTVEEYWQSGQLVAWTATVIKGDTLRAMWFYQRGAVAKSLLWFHALSLAVQRALVMDGVEWVDLGPSKSGRVALSKEQFGFTNTAQWRDPGWCDYAGPYQDAIPWPELQAVLAKCPACRR